MPPPTFQSHTHPALSEDWDESYLTVLSANNWRQLRELLARSNPEVVMPLSSTPPLSQVVILTLVWRLAVTIREAPSVDRGLESTLLWLRRAASVLDPSDLIISLQAPGIGFNKGTADDPPRWTPGGRCCQNDRGHPGYTPQEAIGTVPTRGSPFFLSILLFRCIRQARGVCCYNPSRHDW